MANTRSAAILEAVRQQLQQRAALLDQASDLGQVKLTIKLQAGTCWVRNVIWEEERIMQVREVAR